MDHDPPALTALHTSGDDDPWQAAGFATHDGQLRIGAVIIHTNAPGEGITAWTLTNVDDGVLDGITTFGADVAAADRGQAHAAGVGDVRQRPLDAEHVAGVRRPPPPDDPQHPNTATRIDHVVVLTPDLDRTTHALEARGIELRRTRPAGKNREQRFFRLGEVILELVGAPEAHNQGPATFWGLAITVADLDAAATLLGDHLGSMRDAVQPGRRIATVRHEALGLPVPLAFMSAPPS